MSEKYVLITGATSGIGRVSASKFAAEGATVLIHGRSKEKVNKTIEEIKSERGECPLFGHVADLSIPSEVKSFADVIQSKYDRIHVLINNAGLGPAHDKIFEVNYLATVILSLKLKESLKRAHGRIINIASEAQAPVDFNHFMESRGMEAYAQSKLAVIQFSFLLAEKYKSEGISVNALDPGSFLATKMVKETWGHDGRDINIGADAHLKLGLSEELKGVSGEFFSEGILAKAHSDAYDKSLQAKLWELTQKTVPCTFGFAFAKD